MNKKTYVLKYSERINRSILIRYVLVPVGGAAVILALVATILKAYESQQFLVLSLFLICSGFVGQVLFAPPNYIRNRKDFKGRSITVKGKGFWVADHKSGEVMSFSVNDVTEYIVVSFSFSTYRAIILKISRNRVLAVSNSMENYHTLERMLKTLNHLTKRRKFMRLGAHIQESIW